MWNKSLRTMAGIAAVSLFLIGCSNQQQTTPLAHYQTVKITPVTQVERPPSLRAHAVRLGASDMYGDMVYAHYLAYKNRQEESLAEAPNEIPFR